MKIIIFIFALSLIISCSEKSSKKELSEQDYKKYASFGKEIVKNSSLVLKSNLMSAIKAGGVTGAIKFCNVKAHFLMDSLSQAMGVTIKRTTFKVRNPNDNPDDIEIKALNTFKKMKQEQKVLHPILKQINDNELGYYYPILIDNPICLNCHGTLGETIDSTVFKTLKEYYPTDNATGYKLGDFRGMWSVKIPIKK